MLEHITGKRKIYRGCFDEIEICYASYHTFDVWVHVFRKMLPRIYSDSATSNDIVYKVSVAATEV
jgi:hypothetical protein